MNENARIKCVWKPTESRLCLTHYTVLMNYTCISPLLNAEGKSYSSIIVLFVQNARVQPLLQLTIKIFLYGNDCPSKLPLPVVTVGNVDPHLIYGFLGPPESHPDLDRFSRFCTAHKSIPITLQCTPFSPRNWPFPWRTCTPSIIHVSLGPSDSACQTTSRSAVFVYDMIRYDIFTCSQKVTI